MHSLRLALLILPLFAAGGSAAADAVPAAPAYEALTKCLKEAAAHTAEKCVGANCEPEQLKRTIPWAQKARCGYTEAREDAALPIPPEPLLKCLRQTAADTIDACERGGCFPNSIYFIVGETQKARCRYTAMEPMKLPPATVQSAN